MVRFKISAFSDEYSAVLDEQIKGLCANKVRMTELRGVDGTNVSSLTLEAAKETHKKLEAAGISVSAIGSPIGKIQITDSFEEHLDLLKHTCEIAKIMQTPRIRIFSFYIPDGKHDEYKFEVFKRMEKMLDVADEYEVKLCHENEKGIYGESAEKCLELMEEFDGRMGCVFDPANYVLCGYESFEYGFNLLKKYITYMHIKDATASNAIVPAGAGIGGIPEILAVINNSFKGDVILTIEPHLRVFDGLAALEGTNRRSAVTNEYSTAAEAFEAAVTALRSCLPRTCEQY